jgi:ketosteroid isomerase-like protein
MPNLVQVVKDIYAAFGRGDIPFIMTHVAEGVSWEAEGPAEMVFTGIRHGANETLGFFKGIAQEHADPNLEMTEFVGSDDSVAAFGRYQATVRKTGRRVDTPVAHLFKFRNGKIVRHVNLVNTAAFVEAARSAGA